MKKQVIIMMLFTLMMGSMDAQQVFQYKNLEVKNKTIQERNKFDLGLGLGIEYSGFLGAQLEYAPISHLGIFASGGYFLAGLGWDVGVKAYLMPKIKSKSFRVYATGMYGTNVAIFVVDANQYNKIYLGPSVGAGLEMRFGAKKVNGLNIGLILPFRSPDYDLDIDALKNNPNIEDLSEPLPVGISVGYHREF